MNAPGQSPQNPAALENRDDKIAVLLQKIIELLEEIDDSLANIAGELDSIHRDLP